MYRALYLIPFALALLALVPSSQAQNTAPIGVQDLYVVELNQVLNVPEESDVLQNDYDREGDSFSLTNGTLPDHGELVFLEGGSFRYTPDADFVGTDTFGYRISDGSLSSPLTTVTIEVLPSPNRAPVAVVDAYTTPFETPLTVSAADGLFQNDYDPDGDNIFVGFFNSLASDGTLSNTNISTGTFTFTPDAGFTGVTSFTYRVRDPDFAVSNIVEVFIGVGVDVVLPVELVRFEGLLDGDTVRLSWDTASETNNAGFQIERSINGQPFEALGFVDGNGTVAEPQSYGFVDSVLPFDADGLTYRLKQIDYDGTFEYSPLVELDVNTPNAFALHENFPNPFRTSTTIRYELPQSATVQLAVYDAQGREVAQLIDGPQSAGRHAIPFDAAGLASGVYFYRLETENGRRQSGRMVLVSD